ncbi:MAG: nuclear transport factor 2 family protein [Geodermatophilaceae bacterium]|nr:nuclear transport factor 2 family protein [Geodermatophilaceae bacterium]
MGVVVRSERIRAAINAGDLDGLVALFEDDYRNETPAHPSRGFTGAEQVRRNWTQILGSVADLRVELLRGTTDDDGAEWAEWSWSGTRADGGPMRMAGVTILGGPGERIGWARFYLEPIEQAGPTVTAAVDDVVGRG